MSKKNGPRRLGRGPKSRFFKWLLEKQSDPTPPGGGGTATGLDAVAAECGGAVAVTLIRQTEVPALLRQAMAGDRRAAEMMGVVAEALVAVARDGRLCLACTTELSFDHPPRAFAVICAHRDDPQAASLVGICPACCARHNDDYLIGVVAGQIGVRLFDPAALSTVAGRA
jgi:hypothetical protein